MLAFMIRFIGAGLLVACLPLIAARAGDNVAGVVLLFPVVTASGFIVLGLDRGIESVGHASVTSVAAVPAVIMFLLGVHLSARQQTTVAWAIANGTIAWMLAAGAVILLSKRWRTL